MSWSPSPRNVTGGVLEKQRLRWCFRSQVLSRAQPRERGGAGLDQGAHAAMLARQSRGKNSGAGTAHQSGQTCYPSLSWPLAAAHPIRLQICNWGRPWSI